MAVTLCPLCSGASTTPFSEDRRRPYRRCPRCALVFVPPLWRPTPAAERAEYDRHENRLDDPGYRRFLARLATPLLAALPPAQAGLDFGCGPGPALAAMLGEAGHRVALYDPFYAPDPAALALGGRDFITATEVVEHLHQPGLELARLWARLRVGGVLGIMTKHLRSRAAFDRWHYKNDPTHVCFFSRATWRWWAAGRRARLVFVADDALLLHKLGG
ncbi:class I SAM-dependent methyltransferase [Pseudohaliea rubra]|uniref:Putative methyltransferase associated with n=1 Tax=Pseudohaliea rubra DSM 19751 TaxID=1265313 RepID=A0A095VRG4_9GAMM|nr:class I SAM-dependent methyltransferase [Pseudohaliea rubra]KGE04042.1 putative methyltransferase associated with [Pseudohaliea rubra DSM 19751]